MQMSVLNSEYRLAGTDTMNRSFRQFQTVTAKRTLSLVKSLVMHYCLETKPDKGYHPCRTNPKESNKVYF